MTYPRMLYRPGATDTPIWGEQLQTLIVNSAQEERDAVRDGWIVDDAKAREKAKRRRQIKDAVSMFTSRWDTWVQFALTAIGLYLAYLAIR